MQQGYSQQVYRQQDIVGANPIRLVVMAYDLAIHACEQKDFIRATQAISVLRDALNFDYPEASVGLFRLYQWSLDCIRSGDYESTKNTLKELREAWVTAEERLASSSTPQPSIPDVSSQINRPPIARA